MSTRKRGEKWVIDFYVNGRAGKRIIRSLPPSTTEEEAQTIEETLRKKLNGKNDIQGTVGNLFKEYLQWYLLYRAKTTNRDIRSVYQNHILPLLGDFLIASIDRKKIEYYQHYRLKEGGKPRSINKELSYLGGFLSWCEKERKIEQKPKIQMLPYARPEPQIWMPEEILPLLDNMEQPYKAFCSALYFQGLRFSDANGMIWENVDFGSNMLKVIQKGNTWKVLPINERMKKELLEIIPGENPKGLVFRSRITGRKLVDIRAALKRAKAMTKTNKRLYPHLFRHSLATSALAAGANPRLLQAYLGHKDFESTQFYLHLIPQHLQQVAQSIDTFTRSKPETIMITSGSGEMVTTQEVEKHP
jgi:site-specific recombinase XerD